MAVKLDTVVPFGRSFDEYVKMFNLTATELQQPILSVADGPASFNAEGTQLEPVGAFEQKPTVMSTALLGNAFQCTILFSSFG